MKLFAILPLLVTLAAPAPAETRAVLVGVADYLVLDADLKGPANDVRLMAEVLAERGVKPSDMVALTSDAAGLPPGIATGAPTRAAILQALQDVVARAEPGDTVVFYFSGHGGQAPDRNGDEGGGYDEIFLPADAANWKGDVGAVENAIVDDELQDWARGLLARGVRVVGLIDACHADTGFRGLGGAGRPRGLSGEDLGIPADAAPVAAGDPAPPLPGEFVFLYAAQSDQRSFEYPIGAGGGWQGAFTLRLAQALRTAGEAPWSQVLAEVATGLAADPAPQMPDGEGPLLSVAPFGNPAPQRFAVQDGQIAAGLLQGLEPGSLIGFFAEASGGVPLATFTLTKVEARSTPLPADAPAAAFAQVLAPAPPPQLKIAAPVRADPDDGADYASWIAALGPGEAEADLVPILTGGGLALARADGRLDPDGPGSTPRVMPLPGETPADALARVLAAAAQSLRLERLFAATAGRSLTGAAALETRWTRRPATPADDGCGAPGPAEPVDPAKGLAPCDQLWLETKNVSGQPIDLSILYFNADFTISPIWPKAGQSNRLAPGEVMKTGLQIAPGSAGVEDMLLLAVPVEPGQPRVDLTALADPEGASRGGAAADWFRQGLDPDTQTRSFSLRPPALMLTQQTVRIAPKP